MTDEFERLQNRVKDLEDKMAEKDVEFAIINTKLSAILWGLGVVGAAVIGVLVKLVFHV